MKVVLPEHLVEKLCVLPESGEGYQRVRISTASGDKHGNLIVLGCNELYVPDTLKLAATEIEDIELDVPKSIDTPSGEVKLMSNNIKMTVVPKVNEMKATKDEGKPDTKKVEVTESPLPLIGGGGLLAILEKLLPLLTKVPMDDTFEVLGDDDFDGDDPAVQEFKNQGGCAGMSKLVIKLTPEEATQKLSQVIAAVKKVRTANRLNLMRQTFSAIHSAQNNGRKQAQAVEALDGLMYDTALNTAEYHELSKAREAVLAGTPQHFDAAKYRVRNVFAMYVQKPNVRTAYTQLNTQVNEPCLMCPKGNFVWGHPVPMEISKCRENCIDSRTDRQGHVTCAYSEWLKVADNQEAVFARMDTVKHTDGESNFLNLKPGERSRNNDLGVYEQRFTEQKLHTGDKNAEEMWDKSREKQLDDAKEAYLGHHGETEKSVQQVLEKTAGVGTDRIDPDCEDTMGTQISKAFPKPHDDKTREQMLDDEFAGLRDHELDEVLELLISQDEKFWKQREKERKH